MNRIQCIIQKILQVVSKGILRAISWKLEVSLPPVPKYVLIGAPHTSAWDFIFTMLLIYSTRLNVKWIAKDSLFRGPTGVFVRGLGGIEVNRRQRSNFVDQIVKVLNRHDHLIIAIAPEGTRDKADYWKTGFYYIALGAKVPIAMGFVDYEKKVVGIGPYFYPDGEIQSDFEHQIKVFYADKKGRYPEKQGAIRLLDSSELISKKDDTSLPPAPR